MRKRIVVKNNYGIGRSGLLGILFVALKLTGYITWSWFWVTAPFWMPIAILLTFAAFVFGIALLAR